MKFKTLLLTIFPVAGMLSAQTVQQFSGHHYTGTPCSSPSGGVNCAYIAQPQGTTNDPYASYLYITDGGDAASQVARIRWARSMGYKQYKILPLLQAMVGRGPLAEPIDEDTNDD